MRLTAAFLASLAISACGAEPPFETPETPAGETETTADFTARDEIGPSPGAEAGLAGVLTAQGWGPLRIGMTLEEVNAAAGLDDHPGAVGGPEPEACDQFHPADAPDGMLVMIEDGVLTRISLIRGAELETDAGIGLGDGPQAIRDAYGDAVIVTPNKYVPEPAQNFTVWESGDTGADYIADPEARGIRYQVDQTGEINIIHAGGPSIQYVEGCA